MATRKTIEAKVVEWFETAEVETAWVVLWIVAGKMRERERAARPTTGTTRKVKTAHTKDLTTVGTLQVANAAD